MTLPLITLNLDTPRARRTDPSTSHRVADITAGPKRLATKHVVERALHTAGHPITSDEVYRIARHELGLFCTPQRVRTVLAEENSGPWVRLPDTGASEFGNDAHLWAINEEQS